MPTRGRSTRRSNARWTPCAYRTATGTSRRSPAASAAALRSHGCCCRRRISCCSTSRRTISTPSRSRGSSASSPTMREPSSRSRTTDTSSTTSRVGFWSSTAARASRTRGTTRAGWSRSRPGSPGRRSRSRRGAARSRGSWNGCGHRRQARHAKSKARVAAYEKLLAEEKSVKLDRVEIHIPAGPRLGDLVVAADGLAKGFGDRLLFEDASFSLPPGGIVGVVGPNGAGKTTLFRMIVGDEVPDAGALRVGDTVEIAYVDQARADLTPSSSVWKEISGGHDSIELGSREVNSRQYVSWFNFKGADQQKRVGDLSGGERNRVHLAKLLRSGGNLLLLDEPTNDLDVDTLARAGGRTARVRGLRRRHLARPLVPRPHRHAHPRVRRRLAGDVVRGQLGGVRRVGEGDTRRGRARAAPDQVQAARAPRRVMGQVARRT